MKKAQMEMMGLVIIVVLITTIFLFVLKFNIDKEPDTARPDFIHAELAANTLSALLKLDSRCSQLTMTELLQDCGRNPPGGKTEVLCENKDPILAATPQPSCAAAQDTFRRVLNKTLNAKGISFRYSLRSTVTPGGPFLEYDHPDNKVDCSTSEKTVEIYPIPLHPSDTMFVRLEICR